MEVIIIIELIYYPIHHQFNDYQLLRKKIDIKNVATIEIILKMLNAKGLARWKKDKWGGKVIENYQSEGKLVNNGKYFILSGDIIKTIAYFKM